jgi:hypothetical protein
MRSRNVMVSRTAGDGEGPKKQRVENCLREGRRLPTVDVEGYILYSGGRKGGM